MNKNFKIIGLFVIIVISLFSCEKINIDENVSNNKSHDYKFVNPDWVLVDESYIDVNGNFGVLYENANNPIEKMFQVKEMQTKASGERVKYTGNLRTSTSADPFGNSTTTTTCDNSCSPKNCAMTVTESSITIIRK